jgi:GntR family transcriptional regulator
MVRVINPLDDRPLVRQVAALLRERIATGKLRPGDRVPGSTQLQDEFHISSTTARQALDLLRNEGLVTVVSGKGTFVREPAPVRRLSSERYAEQLAALAAGQVPKESAFTRDHGITWDQFTVEADFREDKADARVAILMDIEPGVLAFRRHMVMYAAGRPKQTRVGWYPLDLVAGTAMTDPTRQPWPGGVIAELAAIGVTPASVDEDIVTRMPTPEETSVLRIAGGTPVFVITRVGRDRAGRAIEVADITLPGDSIVLHYRLEL